MTLDPKAIRKGDYIISHEPAHRIIEVGDRVELAWSSRHYVGTVIMAEPTYTVATALAEIEKCDFECEGGPLANNTGYLWLKDHLTKGPKFSLGQWVHHEVCAEVNGIKIANLVRLCVVAIAMSSDTDRRTWTYSLSTDPPQPNHYGSGVQFVGVAENKLQAEPGAEAGEQDEGTPEHD